MKRNILIKIAVLAVAAAMVLSCFGCSMISVNEERQQNQVVAVVNGTELKYSDYQAELNNTLYNTYGYTNDQFEALEDDRKSELQEAVLKQLVDDELKYQDAMANGYELTDEQVEELKKQFNDEIDNLGPNYRTLLEYNGSYTEEEMDRMTEEYVTEQLGEDFDWDKTFAKVCRDEVIGNYENDIKQKQSVSEDEIKEYYDVNVENQKNMLEPADGSSESTYGLLEAFGSTVYVYPPDVRRVQHLMIGIDTDTRTKILAYRNSGEDEEADRIREEALAKIKDKAEEVYAMVTSEPDMTDEKFAEFMDNYGDDQSAVYGDYRLKGYIVHSYSSTQNYPPEMIDEALSMTEVGQISKLFTSDYGYEILRLVSFPDQVIPLEELHDSIEEELLTSKQDSAVREKETELEEAADIKYYYDRVKD